VKSSWCSKLVDKRLLLRQTRLKPEPKYGSLITLLLLQLLRLWPQTETTAASHCCCQILGQPSKYGQNDSNEGTYHPCYFLSNRWYQ
jgi:hypothetical protein